ncbi:T-cell immunomodulatory protein-like [Sinocyclocheilus anshuiensis]|uniref:T-cell immunomodulatory protein-like n=1 Tax=Sinocyclocheilus anshuiensis TaxID=1608454 RepID=UPI0007B87171|nr:PREDICTED: T-cell immunomodulatory protein-like [Sinocyclocheilus anshuiensis]
MVTEANSKMLLSWAWFLTLLLSFVGQHVTFALQDVTSDLFGPENYGMVAAFGDFNSDKQTDIFIIRKRSELVIFLADLKAPYFKPKVHLTKEAFPSDFNISSVVPGDYDGDSQMDVLLTGYTKGSTSKTFVFIFWGHNQTLDQSHRVDLNRTFNDQPLVMDFNGDMIPDIFGSVGGSSEVCYLRSRQQKCETALSLEVKMRVPHSNAFIDLNKDFTADLFLTTADGYETWINKDGNFTQALSGKAPENAKKVGQSAFVDFDGDGSQDHLLPVCMDIACDRSAIYLAKPGETELQWVPLLTDFRRKDSVWGFVPSLDIPITLHLGDYNLDGFPDALVILRNTSASTQQQAFLLENVACNNVSCQAAGRMFRVHWEQSDLSAIPKAVVATFFDIYEDGILDMIVLSKVEGKEEHVIHALKNNFEADAYFVKVIVLSGLCSNDCPENVKPFGVNQPGPYVMYTSVDSNGYLKNASGEYTAQKRLTLDGKGITHISLPRISCLSKLQIPPVFHRGTSALVHVCQRTAAEIECAVISITVMVLIFFALILSLPSIILFLLQDVRKQEWTAIIPNSQLIVIPYPQNDPRSWSAKLYLTPSNIVLLTAIALIGVCVFILVIIGILHWQEKKADDREKRQEAHRFHFDAM